MACQVGIDLFHTHRGACKLPTHKQEALQAHWHTTSTTTTISVLQRLIGLCILSAADEVFVFDIHTGGIKARVPTCSSPYRVEPVPWANELLVHCWWVATYNLILAA
eukprot:1138512-Pelagomonas_calceolata.AAC.3